LYHKKHRKEKNMKLDLYTKIVLTVIAGSLFVLSFKAIFPTTAAVAQSGILRVDIVRVDGKTFVSDQVNGSWPQLPVTTKKNES
jgi:hypothetical protein